MMYPHDQPFIDSILAQADRPLAVRKSIAEYMAKMDATPRGEPKRKSASGVVQWQPMIFLRWGLPNFFPVAKKTKRFEFIDAVINGMVDGIKGFSSDNWRTSGDLLADSAKAPRDSILDVYVSNEDRDRLAVMLGELPVPALEALTSRMVSTNETRSSADVFVPASIMLASRLLNNTPDLVRSVKFADLCDGIKWLNGVDPEELVSASQVCKSVFSYQLDPRQGSGFRLHLASAPKSELAALGWALVVLVDECKWGPEQFSQLGDRRALRYLEKAVSRVCLQESSKLIRLPEQEKLMMVKSAVRRATLSASPVPTPPPSTQVSSSPKM